MICNAKRILIGVTGGIAAYKVGGVVSQLAKAGAEVKVVLTKGAEQFVTPLTFATLSRSCAYTDRDFWQECHGKPLHISLAEWAEVILIAPLSANSMGKLVHGIADNLLLNVLLASACPVLLAPAMNTTMWQNPFVQENWRRLLGGGDRYHGIPPADGILACDAVGTGKMAEPELILNCLETIVWTRGKQDLKGKRILVTAGGTREFIDPVRFIGNPASGKQGIAIALAAYHRGAEVSLILANGEFSHPTLPTLHVSNSQEIELAVKQEFPSADILVMNAAVGDVQPQTFSPHKLPKDQLPLQLALAPVPDILKGLGEIKAVHQTLIGFAAQTGTLEEILPLAHAKLVAKGVDIICANSVDQPNSGFGGDRNQAIFLDRYQRQTTTPLCSKLELAHRLWDFARDFLSQS